MKIINVEQGTPEWFACRLGKFTASSAQAIAANGKGLETLVYEKVAEILTGKMKEQYSNEDIERGKNLEDLARNSYEIETGNVVTQVGFIEKAEDIGCSPDGFVGEDGLVEFKCINDVNFAKYLHDGKINSAHEWQMQMQMYVCERDWVDYVVFNENFLDRSTDIKRVELDEGKVAQLKIGLLAGKLRVNEILTSIRGNQ